LPKKIGLSLREKSSNILTFLPNAGKLYGHKEIYEVRTIVTMHKYMIYYIYDETTDTVNILHIFCTLMDDKFLRSRLLEEGICAVR
jgi:plasmid stabilization system protein ParE